MKLKETAIDLIQRGNWAFDVLAPRFRSALERRIHSGQDGQSVPVADISLMNLALLAYEPGLPYRWTGLRAPDRLYVPGVEATQEFAVSNAIAARVYAGAHPVNFQLNDIGTIQSAEDFILDIDPVLYEHLAKWVSGYFMLSNVPFRSASQPHAFGCIFFGEKIREYSFREVAVSIVHEMAHQELFLINLVDRLIEADCDYSLAHAPFQGFDRPPIGRLHSLYALFRMVEFEIRAGLPAMRHRELLIATAESFKTGELTDFGKRLVDVVLGATTRVDSKMVSNK